MGTSPYVNFRTNAVYFVRTARLPIVLHARGALQLGAPADPLVAAIYKAAHYLHHLNVNDRTLFRAVNAPDRAPDPLHQGVPALDHPVAFRCTPSCT